MGSNQKPAMRIPTTAPAVFTPYISPMRSPALPRRVVTKRPSKGRVAPIQVVGTSRSRLTTKNWNTPKATGDSVVAPKLR